jgi:GAF domain-containing protein
MPTTLPAPKDELYDTFASKLSELETYLTETESSLDKRLREWRVQGQASEFTRLLRRQIKLLRVSGEAISERLEQLQGLVYTSALVTSSLHLNDVLNEVMDTIITLTGAERVFVMLHEGDDAELALRAARNWDRAQITEEDQVFSRNVLALVTQQREPLITLNAKDDERFRTATSIQQYEFRSILCVPLVVHDKVIGALYADNRMSKGVFQNSIIPLLTAFANQVAIAIDNARLFEKVQEDLKQATQEVQRLRIQVDQKQVDQEVQSITESAYFQRLEREINELRNAFDADQQP